MSQSASALKKEDSNNQELHQEQGDQKVFNPRKSKRNRHRKLDSSSEVQIRAENINQSSFTQRRKMSQVILVLFVLALAGILLYASVGSYTQSQLIPSPPKQPHLAQPTKNSGLPRILWLYTYNNWQGETAMNRIMLHYYNHTGQINNYEVRIVDSWTAYEWLSQPTIYKISKAIQNVKMDQTVCNLLKMALLMEHGGILIGNLHSLLTENNFEWIEKMFEDESNLNKYKIEPKTAEVYVLPHKPIPTLNYYFKENIFAAVPHSTFITDTFQMLQDICIIGGIKYNQVFGFYRRNHDVQIDYIPYSIASVMTALVYDMTSRNSQADYHVQYSIQVLEDENVIDIKKFRSEESHKILRKNSVLIKDINLLLNTQEVVLDFVKVLLENNQNAQFEKNSIISSILSAPENQRVLMKPLADREIDLCIVGMDEMQKDKIQYMHKIIQEQKYERKQLIVFSNSPGTESKQLQNVTILKNSGNQVRNIEIALTQHCKHKGYAVLLKTGESFSTPQALKIIAETVRDRSVMGATIDLNIEGETRKSKFQYHTYSRSRDGVLNPKLELMNGIINHMRIFSVDAFRYIPQFELRDAYGVYSSDRIIILSSLLQLLAPVEKVRSQEHKHKYLYIMKYYSDIFHFPNKMAMIDSTIYIKSKYYQEVNQAQITKTKLRYDVQSLEQSMDNCERWGVPFSKQLVFNKGEEYIPFEKKKGVQLIPKVIHQVWLGGQKMPQAKRYFFNKVRKLHPNYQMILWTPKDITRQNFPVAYDAMQNLLRYQNTGISTYNKYGVVTDLLRHELMYRKGGFWRNTGMNLLRNVFDDFKKYEMVIGTDLTFRHRWNQRMSFFANEPLSENLHRVVTYQNINRMRFYYPEAAWIAGSIDFRQVVQGDEEQNPNILILHQLYYYPSQANHYPYGDKCLKRVEDFTSQDHFVLTYQGYVLLSRCDSFYTEAFGLEHNKFGSIYEGYQ